MDCVKGTGPLWLLLQTLGAFQHMHKTTNLRNFLLNWSSNLQENNKRKNTIVALYYFVCFQMPNNYKRLQAWSLLLFECEITSFSQTTLVQREPFLTMFYTINSSPYAFLNINAWGTSVVTMLTQNEAMGAATASDWERAPIASFWVGIMTSCRVRVRSIKRGVLLATK